jgi:phosphoribosylformylglycinamidine synthase
VKRRIAVLTFPGTNSEDETLRLLRDCGGDAYLVHWSRAEMLAQYDAYVLPGGFAYEDRIRAGAVAAFDPSMEHVIGGARIGKLVLGICNGAQILLEAGLVPGTGEVRRPTAAFTDNRPSGHFICRHVYAKLSVDPDRSPITAGLVANAVVPAYASNGEGCLAASPDQLRALQDGGHVAFVYSHADGTQYPMARRSVARVCSTRKVMFWRSCRIPSGTRGTFNISTAGSATIRWPRREERCSFEVSSKR